MMLWPNNSFADGALHGIPPTPVAVPVANGDKPIKGAMSEANETLGTDSKVAIQVAKGDKPIKPRVKRAKRMKP